MKLHSTLLALNFFSMCRCEIFDLDDSVPWLTVAHNRVRFSAGWDAFVVADSACVRVNARGVYAKPSHWSERGLASPWVASACLPSARGCLCETERGLVFPEEAVPLYNASRAMGSLSCSRSNDGRVLDPAYGYDVSACDVLDGGGDAVLCGRKIYFYSTGLNEIVYWVLCLIAVFIVRSLSYLVLKDITKQRITNEGGACEHETSSNCVGEEDKASNTGIRALKNGWNKNKSHYATVVACAAVLPLTLVPDGDSIFITVEEALFFDAVCCYSAMYMALFCVCAFTGSMDNPPMYNLIAASLQIIACRLYSSADTPYSVVLIWAVATRAISKMRSQHWGHWVVTWTTMADALLLSLMSAVSFPHERLYLVPIFTLAVATSDAMRPSG